MVDYDVQFEILMEVECQIEFMQMGVDINVWLVFCFLCESKKEEEVCVLYEFVRLEWFYEVLGCGVDMVFFLSGMCFLVLQEDDSGSEKDMIMLEKF